MGTTAQKQAWARRQLCTDCGQPIKPFHTRCEEHYKAHNLATKKYYARHRVAEQKRSTINRERNIKEGKCRTCGKPKNTEVDEVHLRECFNCRQKIRRPRWSRS